MDIRTCTTSKEGWTFYRHFLGNSLDLIPLISLQEKEEKNEEKKYKFRRLIDGTWVPLVGNLFLVRRKMISNGHFQDADKMQHIIDMVAEMDLTDRKVCQKIHEKTKEFSQIING